ncbi:MAG TPA: hypothetical protein VK932_19470 [Kofleriaceae bacterium]|nr:hypothetical protein [Kofleriaceae bacterium]
MGPAASYEEIAQLLGDADEPADEPTIDRIRDTGASATEIAEALAQRGGVARDGEEPPSPSSPRVAEVRAILDEHAELPRADEGAEDDELPRYKESIESVTAD